jgi:urease accessory protein UreF
MLVVSFAVGTAVFGVPVEHYIYMYIYSWMS